MKKKIMIGALAALFLSVGIFIATNLTEKERVSDLTLANIEAMTNIFTHDNEERNDCTSEPNSNCGQMVISNTGNNYTEYLIGYKKAIGWY